MLEEQQKAINSSLDYASVIQNAVLPGSELLKKFFKRNFIFYRPLGKISGDFFWYSEKGDNLILTVGDCTGHGVPGALMSMLGLSFMNEIVAEKRIYSPAQILENLRESIILALKQSAENSVKDGMDISIISINKVTNLMTWAAANNNIYIRTEEELVELKADRQPVSFYEAMKPYTEHTLQLKGRNLLILSSDGYRDQFGGDPPKKFTSARFKTLIDNAYQNESIELMNHFKGTIEDWIGSNGQTDDVTVLGFEINCDSQEES